MGLQDSSPYANQKPITLVLVNLITGQEITKVITLPAGIEGTMQNIKPYFPVGFRGWVDCPAHKRETSIEVREDYYTLVLGFVEAKVLIDIYKGVTVPSYHLHKLRIKGLIGNRSHITALGRRTAVKLLAL